VLNGIETIAEATLWTSIQGADIVDGTTLDADIAEAQGSTVSAAIKDRYAREFQNVADPGLVVVNQTVTVSGSQVSETATASPKLYGYTAGRRRKSTSSAFDTNASTTRNTTISTNPLNNLKD
jgi:hypothetical protein